MTPVDTRGRPGAGLIVPLARLTAVPGTPKIEFGRTTEWPLIFTPLLLYPNVVNPRVVNLPIT